MITMALFGFGLVFVLAGVVGLLDAVRGPAWREVAEQRRDRWESQLQGAGARPERIAPVR